MVNIDIYFVQWMINIEKLSNTEVEHWFDIVVGDVKYFDFVHGPQYILDLVFGQLYSVVEKQ